MHKTNGNLMHIGKAAVMLRCENLEKRYMNVTAIADISTEIEPGKIYGLAWS